MGLLRSMMAYADAAYMDEKRTKEAIAVSDGATIWSKRSGPPPGKKDGPQYEGCDIALVKGRVLSWAGSNDVGDWWSNFDWTTIGGVHKGFWDSVKPFWTNILKWAREKTDGIDGGSVYITGHSRGGGLAQVTALRLWQAGIQRVVLTTFGSPPAISKAYPDYHLQPWRKCIEAHRVVCGRDIVPRLGDDTMGAVHIGEAIKVSPPWWTWALPGLWAVIDHRRPAYWHGVKRSRM